MAHILYSSIDTDNFVPIARGKKKKLLKLARKLMQQRFGRDGWEGNGEGRFLRKGLPGTPLLDVWVVDEQTEGR